MVPWQDMQQVGCSADGVMDMVGVTEVGVLAVGDPAVGALAVEAVGAVSVALTDIAEENYRRNRI